MIPLSVAMVAGLAGFMRARMMQNKEARELVMADFEGHLDRVRAAIDHNLEMYAKGVDFALQTCNDGLDNLLSVLLATVDRETRMKAFDALSRGVGPYWEDRAAHSPRM